MLFAPGQDFCISTCCENSVSSSTPNMMLFWAILSPNGWLDVGLNNECMLGGSCKLWTDGCVSRTCCLKFPAEMELHSVFLGPTKTVSSPGNSRGRTGTCSKPTTLSLSNSWSFLDKPPVHMHCSSFPYSGPSLKRWSLSRITTALRRSHQKCKLSLEKRSCSGLAPDGSSCRKSAANIIKIHQMASFYLRYTVLGACQVGSYWNLSWRRFHQFQESGHLSIHQFHLDPMSISFYWGRLLYK